MKDRGVLENYEPGAVEDSFHHQSSTYLDRVTARVRVVRGLALIHVAGPSLDNNPVVDCAIGDRAFRARAAAEGLIFAAVSRFGIAARSLANVISHVLLTPCNKQIKGAADKLPRR